jgi:hypothetical protein
MMQSPRQLIKSRSAECVVSGISTPFEITYGQPNDNSAVRYDFTFPHAIARFTWWSDSSYFSESLTLDGGQIVSKHGFAEDALIAAATVRELLVATEHADAT